MASYIGLMSGTSMDAIDAALVNFDGDDRFQLIAYREIVYSGELASDLHAARLLGDRLPLAELGRLDALVGMSFANAALLLLGEARVTAAQVAAIGSHGQTLCHAPGANPPYTVQVGDANIIAARTGIITVADLRRADMALGGQGAPLAPSFHAHVFRHPQRHRIIVNIGGIANITLLPAEQGSPVTGFDTGPGNALLDDWAARHLRKPFDAGGQWSLTGAANAGLLERLLSDPYFGRQPPKSTGREHFNLPWLEAILSDFKPALALADVQATLVELTAASIAAAVRDARLPGAEVLVCGGGAYNDALMEALRASLPAGTVTTTDVAYLAPNAVEAAMCAWLAKQRLEGKASTLPTVTGAQRPAIAGAIYAPPPGS